MTTATITPKRGASDSLTAGRLPRWGSPALLGGTVVASAAVFGILAAASGSAFSVAGWISVAVIAYIVIIYIVSRVVEGSRRAVDRFVTALVTSAFGIAMIPLISLTWTVVERGVARFDITFFTSSMQGVVGPGGGALHAIVGTLLITLAAAIISVPIGLMTSIYLVEYGRGSLARAITFFVDVMTGIPSIVAGLFAYALFSMIFGPGHRSGVSGAIALSVLMIPVVVRSSEEMLRIVPNELREASYALGVPKWLTIAKVVLPTALGGIATGVVLSIARVIGETAPLLLTAGYIANMNYNLFADRMTTLPLFVWTMYRNSGGTDQADLDRVWTGALVLILIVLVLNLGARLIARYFAPKKGR